MEVILTKPFEHQYENEMFESIAERLKRTGQFNAGTSLLAGNLILGGSELDALLIKRDGICILEFKNAEGQVHFVENGPWTVGEGQIKGGSRDNPFTQVRSYRLGVRRFLEKNRDDLVRPYQINPEHVSGCVVFRGGIHFDDRVLDNNVRHWFHVTDQERFPERVAKIQSREINLTPEFIGRFARISGLQGVAGLAHSVKTEPLKVGILKNSPIRESFKRMKDLGHLYADGAAETIRLVTRMIQQNFIPPIDKVARKEDGRIRGSIIFEVTPYCSLLTIRSGNLLFPIVVGDPENLAHWVAKHEGYTITVEGKRGVLVPTKTDLPIESVVPGRPVFHAVSKPIFEALTPEDGLDLAEYIPSNKVRELFAQITHDTSSDEVKDLLLGITVEDHRKYIGDIIHLLLSGDIKGAKARILLRKGEAVPVEKNETSALEAVQDLENSEDVLFPKGLKEQELRDLLDPNRFEDWMLFLHPDQQKFVETEYDRPVVLKGVSGSGKTCILVHRARYLARKYPDQKIGILTLNPKLVTLLQQLVQQLCLGEERERIVVLPFYEVFRRCLQQFGIRRFIESYYQSVLKSDSEPRLLEKEKDPLPSRWRKPAEINPIQKGLRKVEDLGETKIQIDNAIGRWPDGIVWDLDPTSKTSLADQWEQFHVQENPDFKEWMRGVERKLQNETGDAMKYLREEFSLIQSSHALPSRFDDYLEKGGKGGRKGRCIRFDENMRHDCLRLLAFWEEWMITGGFIDESMMALALHFFQKEIQRLPTEYRFRCLLVDEMQDFSTLDLRLIRSLSYAEQPDALFLAGDPVQKILVKSHNLEAANLDRGGANHFDIKKNYRNSRQILEAASMLVQANVERAKNLEESIELLKPELALRETNRPTAVKTDTGGPSQVEAAWKLAKQTLGPSTRAKHAVCIATAAPEVRGLSVEEIIGQVPPGMGAHRLGTIPNHTQSVAVCELEDLKGFEFRSVIVLGCDEDVCPSRRTPAGETWREALRLYVAMTRARDQLFFLHGPQPSEFLMEMWEALDSVNASDILPDESETLRKEVITLRTYAYVDDEPERLGFCRASGCRHKAMIGEDYCYTHGA